jgi:hypothetical protein
VKEKVLTIRARAPPRSGGGAETVGRRRRGTFGREIENYVIKMTATRGKATIGGRARVKQTMRMIEMERTRATKSDNLFQREIPTMNSH